MSLIACYECETPVSEHADRCALCRAPIEAEPIRSRPLVSWPLVTLVIALTCILAGCGDLVAVEGERPVEPPESYAELHAGRGNSAHSDARMMQCDRRGGYFGEAA